ncbi:MAG TPA: hypothetical protein PLG56_08910, partial [Lacunisphaera sp.]|nr:hypothetical protein [Lacunisphaera sp.]
MNHISAPLFSDRHCEERSDEAIQLDRHGALRAPRDDKSPKATGVWCHSRLLRWVSLLPVTGALFAGTPASWEAESGNAAGSGA